LKPFQESPTQKQHTTPFVKNMEVALANPMLLRLLVDNFRDIVKEVNMDCDETGLSIQTMDSSGTALIFLKMNSKLFDRYECQHGLSFGMNVDVVGRILKMCDQSDRVNLSYGGEGDSQDCASWEFESPSGSHSIDFEMKTLDVDATRLALKDDDYHYEVTMPSKSFMESIKTLRDVSETAVLTFSKDRLELTANGEHTTSNLEVTPVNAANDDDCVEFDNHTDQKMVLAFNTRFLGLFTRNGPGISKRCCLKVAKDRPMCLEFLLDGKEDNGQVKFFLAPKSDMSPDAEE